MIKTQKPTVKDLLICWGEVKPRLKHGVAFPPSTKDDLIYEIQKQVTMQNPEQISTIFRRWPKIVEAWPEKFAGWMPWLSMRQAFIVAEISKFKFFPIQWKPASAPLSRLQLDFGFFIGSFEADHSDEWLCADNGQCWKVCKLPWVSCGQAKELADFIKSAGERWLADVCDSDAGGYAELALNLKDAGYELVVF